MMEVWLCKVLLHPGPAKVPLLVGQLSLDAHQAVIGKVISGELGVLPDGCIVEPVSSHRTEGEAHEARRKAQHDAPLEDWRVVMTMAVGA
jgi:hypothetical protein